MEYNFSRKNAKTRKNNMKKHKDNPKLNYVQNNLSKSVELAEKNGLSKLTWEEINKEVKAARKQAKGK